MPYYISPPPRNPLTGILAGVFGILVLAGTFMLGFIALVVAFGIGLLLWLGIYIRLWWARRQMSRRGADPVGAGSPAGQREHAATDSLEAEYTVVSTTREE